MTLLAVKPSEAIVASVAGKKIKIKNIDGPTGVRGRNSDNRLFQEKLNWTVSEPLMNGNLKTCSWIETQTVNKKPCKRKNHIENLNATC